MGDRNPFAPPKKPCETFVCWYLQGSHHSSVSGKTTTKPTKYIYIYICIIKKKKAEQPKVYRKGWESFSSTPPAGQDQTLLWRWGALLLLDPHFQVLRVDPKVYRSTGGGGGGEKLCLRVTRAMPRVTQTRGLRGGGGGSKPPFLGREIWAWKLRGHGPFHGHHLGRGIDVGELMSTIF